MVGRGPIPVPSKALADQLTSLPADQLQKDFPPSPPANIRQKSKHHQNFTLEINRL